MKKAKPGSKEQKQKIVTRDRCPACARGNAKDLTLTDYAKFIVERSSDGGLVFALNKIKVLMKE